MNIYEQYNAYNIASICVMYLYIIDFILARQKKVAISLALLVYHTLMAGLFYVDTLSEEYDSNYYYSEAISQEDYMLGTYRHAVILLAKILDILFGSYIGVFLSFSMFGYIGLYLCMMAIPKTASLSKKDYSMLKVLFLLPGLSYWTSGIGKDSITMLCFGLIVYGIANKKKLIPYLGVMIELAFRTHFGLIFLFALTGAKIIPLKVGKRKSSQLLNAYLMLSLSIVIAVVILYFKFGISSLNSLNQFRQEALEYVAYGSLGARYQSLPDLIKPFAYLIYPISPSGGGVMAMISLENVVILSVVSVVVINMVQKRKKYLYLDNPVFVFGLVMLVVGLPVIAINEVNVGIMLRQKWIFVLSVFLVYFTASRPRSRIGSTVMKRGDA